MSDYTTPAAPAPPGVEHNLEDPDTQGVVAGCWIGIVGTVVASLLLALRIYTKAALAKIFGWDDIALVVAWAIALAVQIIILWGRLNHVLGVHLWDLSIADANLAILMIAVASILYVPLMACAKFSLLLFYQKLSKLAWFKWSCWVVAGVIVSYSIALVLALIFACTPMEKNWDITVQEGTCINKGAIYIATAALNVFTDVIMLVLPIPMIVKLQLPKVQKAGLICMFGVGSLTVITSCVRLALLPPMVTNLDPTWAVAIPSIWISIEASLTIICGSLPTLRLFFRHVAPSLIGEGSTWKRSRANSAYNLNSTDPAANDKVGKRKSIGSQPIRRPDSWQRLGDFDLGDSEAHGSMGDEASTPKDGKIVTTKTTSIRYFSNPAHPPWEDKEGAGKA